MRSQSETSPTLRAGDWVEVKSKEEILATLDKRGSLDGMPFMPEMFQYCGRRFRVWKRAHKTCDTVNKTGGRRLTNAVHLEQLRCDGQAHGGCQAACLLFWKDVWLRPVAGQGDILLGKKPGTLPQKVSVKCTEQDVLENTRLGTLREEHNPTFSCQATRLPEFTTLLSWWDIRQYIEDYTSGNAGIRQIVCGLIYASYYPLTRMRGGRIWRHLYDVFQRLRGGIPFPQRTGTVPEGQLTPACELALQPGEFVRVKSFPNILATLDNQNKNRGLRFDAEEVPFCNGTYRVKCRVNRIINEQTGKMIHFKTESVILENVYCQARYSDRRMFCPRAIYSLWREAWLERVTDAPEARKKQS